MATSRKQQTVVEQEPAAPVPESTATSGSADILFYVGRSCLRYSGEAARNALHDFERLPEEGRTLAALADLSGGVVSVGSAQEGMVAEFHSVTPALPMADVEATDWPVKQGLPGLTVVLGETKSGKTHYVVNVLRPDVIIRFGEPMEHVNFADNVCVVDSFTRVLGLAITLGLMGKTVAIDSLRKLVFGLKGSATEGGVSALVYDMVTELSNLFSSIGVSIVATVNPMVQDELKTLNVFNRLAASGVGAILISNRAVAATDLRLFDGRSFDIPVDEQLGADLSDAYNRRSKALIFGPGMTVVAAKRVAKALRASKSSMVADVVSVSLGDAQPEPIESEPAPRIAPNFSLNLNPDSLK